MIIKNALVYTEDHKFEKKDVRIEDERIAEIAENGQITATDEDVIDGEGMYAIPGLVDIHFHALPYADIVENKRERDVYGKNYQMFYNPMWNFFGDLNTPHSTCYYDSGGAFNFYKHIFDQVIVSADMVKYFDKDNLKIVTETSSGVFI